MNPSPIRFGIVGCGAMSQEYHIPLLLQTPGAEITVLCDRQTHFAQQAKSQNGLASEIVTDVAALAGKVDAAIVAVPPRLHAPISIQLLEMGVDVFCEKPLAISSAEGQKMVDAASRANRLLAVGLMMRLFPSNHWLRRLALSPLLGDLREIRGETGSRLAWNMTSDAYYNKSLTGGGVFFDTGVHMVDWVTWLFGDLQNLRYEDDSCGGVETNACLRGTFTVQGRPVACHLQFSWTHPLANSIRVLGTEGEIEALLRDPDSLILRRTVDGERCEMKVACPVTDPSAYHAQIRDFVEAVRHRRPPAVTAASALRALQVIERAYALRQPMAQPWVETPV